MPGVSGCDRSRFIRQASAGQDLDPFGAGEPIGIESKVRGELAVELDQSGGGNDCRLHAREETVGQAGVRVVEPEMNGHQEVSRTKRLCARRPEGGKECSGAVSSGPEYMVPSGSHLKFRGALALVAWRHAGWQPPQFATLPLSDWLSVRSRPSRRSRGCGLAVEVRGQGACARASPR